MKTSDRVKIIPLSINMFRKNGWRHRRSGLRVQNGHAPYGGGDLDREPLCPEIPAIEFVITCPGSHVETLRIRLTTAENGNTRTDWTRTYTALTEQGNRFIDAFTGEPLSIIMVWLFESLDHYVTHGTLFPESVYDRLPSRDWAGSVMAPNSADSALQQAGIVAKENGMQQRLAAPDFHFRYPE